MVATSRENSLLSNDQLDLWRVKSLVWYPSLDLLSGRKMGMEKSLFNEITSYPIFFRSYFPRVSKLCPPKHEPLDFIYLPQTGAYSHMSIMTRNRPTIITYCFKNRKRFLCICSLGVTETRVWNLKERTAMISRHLYLSSLHDDLQAFRLSMETRRIFPILFRKLQNIFFFHLCKIRLCFIYWYKEHPSLST